MIEILVHLDALGFRVCCVQNEVEGVSSAIVI
jgi:hypothetical protein